MRRRLLTPILTLLLLLTALTGELAAQTPIATGSAWEAADVRTLESGEDEYVALSPDGTRIAGIGAEGGLCVWQVEDMTSACAERVGSVRAESIAWSPDGTAVAFSLDHVVRLDESDIFVYEVADGTLHNLTDDGAEGSVVNTEPGVFVDGVPAWSPDSRELVFVRSQPSDETFGTVIMRIDRAGGEPGRVHRLPLETPYGIFMPMHWLPDDSILYTQVSLDGTDPGDGVWRVGLDGGDARRLLPGARGTEIAGPMLMDVAPEVGLALVYAQFIAESPSLTSPETALVWLLDIETGEVTPVPTLPTASGEPPELAGRPQAAAFAPDGSAFIAVYSSVVQGTVIAATDISTGEVTVLAEDMPAHVGRALPTWSGDRFLLPEREQATLVTLVAPATAATPPPASPAASPVATGGTWRVAETRELDLGARTPTLSPDGRWLAGSGPEGSFCVWDVVTQAPACAGENLPIREETIAWSPDSTAVTFALDAIRLGYESDVYVYELDTGELTNLTDDGTEGGLLKVLDADPPIDDAPAWSPDGEQIVFARSRFGVDDDPGSSTIMRIDRSGGEPVEVIALDVEEPYVVWSPMHWLPDGTLLYSQLSMETEDERNGIWMVSIDGGSPQQIAPGAEGTDIPAPVLVDVDTGGGEVIARSWLLAGQRGLDADQPLYWLVDLETGERTPLPALAGGDDAPRVIDAGYSPDGATILLATLGDEGFALATMDPETLAVAPVEGEPIQGAAPMPGSSLQWASNDTVALHAPQGAVVLTLVPSGDASTASPAASPVASPVAGSAGWRIVDERELPIEARYVAMSPDGAQLAGLGGDGLFCIWVTETLVSTCVEERLPIREETIAWSPDGTAVAFALDAIRQLYESDIYVYEVATGELANLTDDGVEGDLLDSFDTDPPIDDVPAWSPDSRELVFVRSFMGDDAPGTTTIMRIDRTGGEPTEMLPLDGEQPLAVWMPVHWLPDGTLLYAQSTNEIDDPRNGIWKVSIDDGGSPLQIAPGAEGADIPGAMIVDADAERGQAIVFSWVLAGQRGVAGDQSLFWLVEIASGERQPFPAVPGEGAKPPVIIDATYSPDGTTILLVTLTEAGLELMTMDPETLTVTPVDGEPLDVALKPGAALQWAGNDTVLLHFPGGSVLVELEPVA